MESHEKSTADAGLKIALPVADQSISASELDREPVTGPDTNTGAPQQAEIAEVSDGTTESGTIAKSDPKAQFNSHSVSGASGGAFLVVLKPGIDDPDAMIRKDLDMRPIGEPDNEELALYTAIGSTLTVLHAAFSGPHEVSVHNSYVVRLSRVARVGLEKGYVSVASIELENLRASVLALEAPRVKNSYMISLGHYAAWFALVAAAIIGALRFGEVRALLSADVWRSPTEIFAYLWIGAMVGCWLSFGVRNPQLSFDALSQPDKDLLKPPLRLLFTGLLSVTLGLAFVAGAVRVSMGSFDTALLQTSATQIDGGITTATAALSLLIGVFCGIGEQALSASVAQRAKQLVGEAAK